MSLEKPKSSVKSVEEREGLKKKSSDPVPGRLKATARSSFHVQNLKGLHARPCAEIARCCSQFLSAIQLIYEGRSVEAKSLLGLLTLAVPCGARVEISVYGEDAEEALVALLALATQKFDADY